MSQVKNSLIGIVLGAMLFSCQNPNQLCSRGMIFKAVKLYHGNGETKKKIRNLPFRNKKIKQYNSEGVKIMKGREKNFGAGFDCVVCYSVKRGKWKYWNDEGKLIRTEKYSRKVTDSILVTKTFQ